MVSTRNTSRNHAPRMQDQLGDADSRPPGPVEATQANTNEVEALRLVNQRLIEELEQLTRQIQHPREARQTQGDHSSPPHEGLYDLSPPPPPPPWGRCRGGIQSSPGARPTISPWGGRERSGARKMCRERSTASRPT